MREKISEYAKLIAAIVGAAVTSFSTLLPPEVAPWATSLAAFLTAVAVLLVPNAPTARQRDAVLAGQAPLTDVEREADAQAALSRVQGRHEA